MFILNSNGLR